MHSRLHEWRINPIPNEIPYPPQNEFLRYPFLHILVLYLSYIAEYLLGVSHVNTNFHGLGTS